MLWANGCWCESSSYSGRSCYGGVWRGRDWALHVLLSQRLFLFSPVLIRGKCVCVCVRVQDCAHLYYLAVVFRCCLMSWAKARITNAKSLSSPNQVCPHIGTCQLRHAERDKLSLCTQSKFTGWHVHGCPFCLLSQSESTWRVLWSFGHALISLALLRLLYEEIQCCSLYEDCFLWLFRRQASQPGWDWGPILRENLTLSVFNTSTFCDC